MPWPLSLWWKGSTRRRRMIITRSPLRITLGGGGTDLPSYYRDHEGFLIAAAIDKYVYVTVMQIVVLQQDAVFQRLAGRVCGVDEDRFRMGRISQRIVACLTLQHDQRPARKMARVGLPIYRPVPASAPRAASRPRCSAPCMLTPKASSIRAISMRFARGFRYWSR